MKATGIFVILLSQDSFESNCLETKYQTITITMFQGMPICWIQRIYFENSQTELCTSYWVSLNTFTPKILFSKSRLITGNARENIDCLLGLAVFYFRAILVFSQHCTASTILLNLCLAKWVSARLFYPELRQSALCLLCFPTLCHCQGTILASLNFHQHRIGQLLSLFLSPQNYKTVKYIVLLLL